MYPADSCTASAPSALRPVLALGTCTRPARRPWPWHRLPPREAAARHAWHKENRRDDLHAPAPSSRKEDRTTTKTMPGMTTASPGLASAASHHHARPSRPGLASSLCHRLHGPFSGRHFKRGHFSDRPRLFSRSNLFPFPLYRVFVYRLYDFIIGKHEKPVQRRIHKNAISRRDGEAADVIPATVARHRRPCLPGCTCCQARPTASTRPGICCPSSPLSILASTLSFIASRRPPRCHE